MSRLHAPVPLLIAVILVGAQSPVYAQESTACTQSSDSVDVIKDVAFAERMGRPLHADLYVPTASPESARPLVLIHDDRQSRHTLSCLASELAREGVAALAIEYRGPYERLYPAAVEDVLAAVRWLRSEGESYGLEAGAVGAAGKGFGGYLAALVGLSHPDAIQAVAAMGAPMDPATYVPPWTYPYLYHVFLGSPEAQRPDLWKRTSPLQRALRSKSSHSENRTARPSPPFLLLYGEADGANLTGQATKMREALESWGGWVRQVTVDSVTSEAFFEELESRNRASFELVRFFRDRLRALPAGVELTRDVVYASPDGRNLYLDLFRPAHQEEPLPAVLFLHGGGWVWGDKHEMFNEAAELSSHGYVTASVEYREADERIYPAAVDDAKAAVRWLKEHAETLRIHRDRIGAVGNSAGGHLAALLGVTPDQAYFGAAAGPMEPSAAVEAVVTISGVVDMPSLFARDRAAPTTFLGVPLAQNPDLWKEASPAEHVGPESASFLFLHGTEDHLGLHEEMVEMAALLKEAGVTARVYSAEEGEHNFWNYEQWREPAMREMVSFFEETLKRPR